MKPEIHLFVNVAQQYYVSCQNATFTKTDVWNQNNFPQTKVDFEVGDGVGSKYNWLLFEFCITENITHVYFYFIASRIHMTRIAE